MPNLKKLIVAFSIAATLFAIVPSEAEADGPLRRWWRSLKSRRSGCATCYNPQVGAATAAPNAYGLQPGQCMTTCQKTCSRTVVNYVPCTSYRTAWKKVPVTSYKPVTNTDPCTGCTVTCMKPCTTYSYQAQRVPYTTYRPVYRTETYKVPVTTITNNCATGTCATGNCATPASGCSTCPTGVPGYGPTLAPTQNFAPGAIPTPGPTTSTRLEAYPAITPAAEQPPSLLNNVANPQASQRPIIDRFNPGTYNIKASSPKQDFTPTTVRIEDKTARSPVRKRWSYSPIRLASYHAPTRRIETQPTFPSPAITANSTPRNSVNKTSGWVEVQ